MKGDIVKFTQAMAFKGHSTWVALYLMITTVALAFGDPLKPNHAQCDASLGVSNKSVILDEQLTSSSHLFDNLPKPRHYLSYYGRLNEVHGGGAWCSRDESMGQFIQIDFKRNLQVTGISTQGREKGAEWVTHFKIAYQRHHDPVWRYIHDENGTDLIFTGNNDTTTIVHNQFPFPITARKIKVMPLGDLFSIYCMRLEFYGCPWDKGDLLSYVSPQGIRVGNYDFRDRIYDGRFSAETKQLFGGLGALTDGKFGQMELGNLKDWVAYNKSKFFILFKFFQARQIRSITFYMANLPEIYKLFEKVRIEVSDDNVNYRLLLERKAPKDLSNVFNAVKIGFHLNGATGKFLKCTFFVKKHTILLISEVDFLMGTAGPRVTSQHSTKAFTAPTHTLNETIGNRSSKSRAGKDPFSIAGVTDGLEDPSLTTTKAVSRGGSKRTKSFYIIVGVATTMALLFSALILLLVFFLRKDTKDLNRKSSKNATPGAKQYASSDKISEPLLKSTEFQGVTGTSVYMTPDMVHLQGFPLDKEIPRGAVEFGQRIGGGKYGEVFAGQILLPRDGSLRSSLNSIVGQKVYIQALKRGATVEATVQFYDEVRKLACVSHPNICRLVGLCSRTDPMYILTEGVDGVRVDKFLHTATFRDQQSNGKELLLEIAFKIAGAVRYLFSIKFLHRDIAARNVLIGANGQLIKLTHTAASCPIYYDCYYYVQERSELYPVRWMAPEAIAEFSFSPQSDVWAYGVFLWELFTYCCIKPMDVLTDCQVMAHLRSQLCSPVQPNELLPCPKGCPLPVYKLMRQCWEIKPNDRIDLEDLCSQLFG